MNTSSKRVIPSTKEIPPFAFSPESNSRRLRRYLENVTMVLVVLLVGLTALPTLAQQLEKPPPQPVSNNNTLVGAFSVLLNNKPYIIFPHISIESRVAGMAVSAGGNVYSWYRDGTVTAGSKINLDDYRSPYYYTTAPNRTPDDIVAMAISSSDKVYTWYQDGTRSVGTSKDLDYYQPPTPYLLPLQPNGYQLYTPLYIVGITISGTDTVRTYFSNGRMAIGNSLDLGAVASNLPYVTADNRPTTSIIGIAHSKTASQTMSWYKDGYVASGITINFGSAGEPFSQHLTIYSFRTGLDRPVTNPNTIELPGPVVRLRSDFGKLGETVLAPGENFVAAAVGNFHVFRKIGGETALTQRAETFFQDYLQGTSSDPVRNVNSFNDLGDCLNDYPQTQFGQGFCVFQAYDTRAVYDRIGKRFIFLANARNYVWQGVNGAPYDADAPNGECSVYRIGDGDAGKIYSHDYCDKGRRHLMIAVSKSEDPADGFHLYAVKRSNYRDWPMLSIHENQLIVGLKGTENPDGYVAIVFDLQQMRNGSKRPRYFMLHKEDIDDGINEGTILYFPRFQEGNPLTVGISNFGTVWGFSKSDTGYTKPQMQNSSGVQLRGDVTWVASHGALRLVTSSPAGDPVGNARIINYGKYPLTADSVNGIVVTTSVSEGAIPYGPLSLPSSDYVSFECPRLTVTTYGDEVIGFTGVRSSNDQRVYYDAAFIKRGPGIQNFSAPEAYSLGSYKDLLSNNTINGVTYRDDLCDWQGGTARDPIHRRAWLMNNYGMEPSTGIFSIPRGALGWVEP